MNLTRNAGIKFMNGGGQRGAVSTNFLKKYIVIKFGMQVNRTRIYMVNKFQQNIIIRLIMTTVKQHV